MKTLTQHIQESLSKKSIKEVNNEKPVDEGSASFMRVIPTPKINKHSNEELTEEYQISKDEE